MTAFRLVRHHLSKRAPTDLATRVSGDMAGAQAQVLSAAQISIWARARVPSIKALDDAIWKDRTLVRAWCMRRTMFLVPSDELALFVRGTARRSEYHYSWALARVSSGHLLDRLLDEVAEFLDRPRSRKEIAGHLKSRGHRLKSKAGGGWGDSREVPWVEVGGALIPVGFLIHTLGAQEAVCSGPNVGNESTYVRADRWIPHWKDLPRDQAENELLMKYLRAYGPSTLTDFALWMGLYVRDVKEIWSRSRDKMTQVDVEGWKAEVLEADASDLEAAKVEEANAHLLPNFDTFLLGHKSHRNIVDERNHKKVYRDQGWVSPVLLVSGRAAGVWQYRQRKDGLEVYVSPFERLSADTKSRVREEAAGLGRFLGSESARVSFA